MVRSGQTLTERAKPDFASKTLGDAGVAAAPDDVVVDGVGNVPAGFAAGSGGPLIGADFAFAGNVAGPAERHAVLHLAVDVVRDAVVGGDVVHLRDGQANQRKERPRVVLIMTPPSLPIIMRSGLVGSAHMSWLSPPQPPP